MNQYSSKLFLLRGLGGRNHLKTMSPKEVLYAHKVNRVIIFNLLHTACFFFYSIIGLWYLGVENTFSF